MNDSLQSGNQLILLPLPERTPDSEPKIRTIKYPIWTESKASLIEHYLFYFVQITKHGTYIDGFAGPQTEDDSELWTAKRVLNSKPHWFRNFFLIDASRQQAEHLRCLKESQPEIRNRKINVFEGDCNVIIPEILKSREITDKACFCLLDQRTTECHGATVKTVAEYKSGNKIEIFYFLMNWWFGRTLSAEQNTDKLDRWFGSSGWRVFRELKPLARAMHMCDRFKNELGYKSAKPWPIYGDAQDGNRVMYYMIHATDHPEAPKLMSRAYAHTVRPDKSARQSWFPFESLENRPMSAP
jgi:three-Cys-motif partner protein